ncbi:MAG: hypothetical protein C0467_02615 [Planctomycetaceae bacterium]|nr:hypothetical protein [Planctomycetaceae bacterium]
MKRFRVKLVGFGCVVLAGTAFGADGPWQPATRPTPPPPAEVSAPASAAEGVGAIRLKPVEPVPPVVAPASSTTIQVQPAWQPISPRVGMAMPQPPLAEPKLAPPAPPAPALTRPLPALPPIPAVDETAPAPAAQDQPPRMVIPTPLPRDFFVPPKPLEMIPPELPGTPRQMLPQPKPVPNENGTSADELPIAPPDLMIPAGAVVPGQRGTFGSKPINISRDFPTFFDGGLREQLGLAGEGTRTRGFVQGEYLMWWATPLNIPVLGTTNTLGGAGFIGEPGTVPIIGPGEFISPFRNGFRVRAGTWLGNGCGIDGSFFFLGNKTAEVTRTSNEFPTITRPVFSPNPVPGGGVVGNTGEAVTVPGVLTGSLSARAESVIFGFDANIRKCLHTCCDWHAEWFVGYRNVSMQESLTITENINVVGVGAGLGLPDPVGTVVFVQDRFATNNYFNGVQLGGLYERNWGRVSLTGRASVALGATTQEIEISGVQVRTRPGMAPMVFNNGGLLAAGPNIGSFSRTAFSVVPELTVNVGYRVSPSVRVYTGYNLLYWSNVVRPGDQIDGVVDLTNVPNGPPATPSGLARPAVPFRQSDMWISGVQFGAEFRW